MFDPENFKTELLFITRENFEEKALQVFRYQWNHNRIYRSFCDHLYIDPEKVDNVVKIPFLPIEFFKNHRIVTGDHETPTTFMSSGTTGDSRSKHYVRDVSFYHKAAQTIFENQYGELKQWEIFALLPSYLEQGNSSLIDMVDFFIKKSQHTSGFLLDDFQAFSQSLERKSKHKRMVFGVSYALLDFGEKLQNTPDVTVVMETGGMKGRRKELTRMELHASLKKHYQQTHIHSEYGMTELLSQAYGKDGKFYFPEWCRVLVRDINDPFSYLTAEKTGGLNIIDLANLESCSFIETKDLGKIHQDGGFEVLGRFDNSDIRGCNLLV